MESNNFITEIVVLAVVIVPIIIVAVLVNKKKRKLALIAGQLETQYQLKFTDFDRWDDLIIGLDNTVGKLVWHKAGASSNVNNCIDLRNLKQCKMIKDMRTVNYKGESSQALDRLALELVPKDANASPFILEFYDAKDRFILNVQGQILEKWHQLISGQLAKAS